MATAQRASSRGDLQRRVRRLGRWLVPYALVTEYQQRRSAARLRSERQKLLAGRSRESVTVPYDFDDSVSFLVNERHLDPEHVRYGSMPLSSLQTARSAIEHELPTDRPLLGLHVGNFLGLSLAYCIDTIRRQHPGSVMLSVDPGVAHRGIVRPQEHALALLDRYGFHGSHVFAQGFSLKREVGDASSVSDPDLASLLSHHAPDGVLDSLITLGCKFDLALFDGNHEGDYLQAEVERLHALLRPGGLLVMDDVEPDGRWVGVFQVFERTKSDSAFEFADADGRIAVFRRTRN